VGKELAVKKNAPELLEKSLRRYARRKRYGYIALSSSTEPWMYIEEKYRVTRKCLQVILRHRFPVHCGTKSTLILRDLDLLKEIDENAYIPIDLKDKVSHGVFITMSFSTLDENIAKIFEPNSPRPKDRLKVLEKVKNEGFYAGIAFIPVLPFISDSDEILEEFVKTSREYNVDYTFIGALTLFGFGKKLYYRVLENNFK